MDDDYYYLAVKYLNSDYFIDFHDSIKLPYYDSYINESGTMFKKSEIKQEFNRLFNREPTTLKEAILGVSNFYFLCRNLHIFNINRSIGCGRIYINDYGYSYTDDVEYCKYVEPNSNKCECGDTCNFIYPIIPIDKILTEPFLYCRLTDIRSDATLYDGSNINYIKYICDGPHKVKLNNDKNYVCYNNMDILENERISFKDYLKYPNNNDISKPNPKYIGKYVVVDKLIYSLNYPEPGIDYTKYIKLKIE